MPSFRARATTVSDGANVIFTVPFPYLEPQHVIVQVRAAEDADPVVLLYGLDYTFTSTSVIELTSPVHEGYFVDRIRQSGIEAPIVPFGGGTLTNYQLQSNQLQMLYLVQEAEDLALASGGTTTIIVDPGGGGGGEGVTLTVPRYGFQNHSGPPYAGLIIDEQGQLGQSFDRDLWLDMFYTDDTTTDTQALLAFAALFNAGTIADCRLNFTPARGRGPAGRYIIDQEVIFTGGSRLVLDFHDATVRWTTPAARIRYKAPPITGSSSVTPIAFFIVRNVLCQYAAAIDSLFYWDFPYTPSRDMGTGYVENLRAYPQDNNNAGHTTVATFRCKNTWVWSARNCHAKGPPRPAGSYVAGNCFVALDGLCVVSSILNCEGLFYDQVVIATPAALVSCNASVTGGALTRGMRLVSSHGQAYMGDSAALYGGRTYTLYEETGALLDGDVCAVYDVEGNLTGRVATISSVTRGTKSPEAILFQGLPGFFCNNAINFTKPANSFDGGLLEIVMMATYFTPNSSVLKLKGCASVSVGPGCEFDLTTANTTLFDIDTCDLLSITGAVTTTGDKANCTFLKARNITAGVVANNTLYFFKYGGDFDNTVKSLKVHSNSAYEVATGNNPTLTTFLNTGNRYNAANARGIDFRGNGRMGRGFDVDDNHMLAWAPVPTASSGASLTYTTTPGGGVNVSNGVLTLRAKLTLNSIGSAASSPGNQMYLSFPASTLLTEFGIPASSIGDFVVNCRINTLMVPAIYDSTNSRIVISDADPYRNANPGNAFKQSDGALTPPYAVFVQASVPVQYD